mmetsp:Transcript_24013/g.60743  ORF Transcript_24013/g.60743 Transcript_24013/m.60743 type:complete len:200 (-) Transcript_24013:621-1220(-)
MAALARTWTIWCRLSRAGGSWRIGRCEGCSLPAARALSPLRQRLCPAGFRGECVRPPPRAQPEQPHRHHAVAQRIRRGGGRGLAGGAEGTGRRGQGTCVGACGCGLARGGGSHRRGGPAVSPCGGRIGFSRKARSLDSRTLRTVGGACEAWRANAYLRDRRALPRLVVVPPAGELLGLGQRRREATGAHLRGGGTCLCG